MRKMWFGKFRYVVKSRDIWLFFEDNYIVIVNFGCLVDVSTQDVARKFSNWVSIVYVYIVENNGLGISNFKHAGMLDFSVDG